MKLDSSYTAQHSNSKTETNTQKKKLKRLKEHKLVVLSHSFLKKLSLGTSPFFKEKHFFIFTFLVSFRKTKILKIRKKISFNQINFRRTKEEEKKRKKNWRIYVEVYLRIIHEWWFFAVLKNNEKTNIYFYSNYLPNIRMLKH